MPRVSIVMALYNTPLKYLTKTLKSLLNQTYKDFELIIVDDFSTFEYEQFFKKLNDSRIKYFKLGKNSGPGAARNFGIKIALGEYIAIADSDDVYLSERIEKQVEYLDNNKNISILGASYRASNKKTISEAVVGVKNIQTHFLFNSVLSNPVIMIRKDDIIEKKLFYPEDTNFAEDYKLWINAMFAGLSCDNLKECLMIYTRRGNQLSKEKMQVQQQKLKQIYAHIYNQLGIQFDDEIINIHYEIYSNKFIHTKNEQDIKNVFSKLFLANKEKHLFDDSLLMELEESAIKSFCGKKDLIFKVKVGKNDVRLEKSLKIKVIARN